MADGVMSSSVSDDISGADWLSSVRWTSDGLVPVITQDAESGQVLMFAWMNAETLAESASTGYAVYYSRSRQKRWKKGESSGNEQRIKTISIDCDEDVILLSVEQQGGIACHTGRAHCFFRELVDGQWSVNEPVLRDPADMYGGKSE